MTLDIGTRDSLRQVWEFLASMENPTESMCLSAAALSHRVLALYPHSPEGWLLKAQVQLHLGDPASGWSAAAMALQYDPTLFEGHFVHAVAQFELGHHRDALRSLTRALHHMPREANRAVEELLHCQHARTLAALTRVAEAIQVLDAALVRFPESELLQRTREPLLLQQARDRLTVLEDAG